MPGWCAAPYAVLYDTNVNVYLFLLPSTYELFFLYIYCPALLLL